eukprot:6041082-Prymnesium_polylepis.1
MLCVWWGQWCTCPRVSRARGRARGSCVAQRYPLMPHGAASRHHRTSTPGRSGRTPDSAPTEAGPLVETRFRERSPRALCDVLCRDRTSRVELASAQS